MAHDPHAHAHASADDEYLNPASGSGHEHTDANVSMIIQFAVWLTVSAIVVHILMWFTFAIFVDLRENTGPAEFPLAAEQSPRLPAGPRLQAKPANEIYDFRRRETADLEGYSWVDKGAGTVRIPIAEAMRLTVERGLPSRAADGAAAGAPTETSTLMPTDASAGRTLERRRQ
jgi:hypothetical protein